ncbi:MAG: ECF-type sigma factor [Planctomycetota bacterium]
MPSETRATELLSRMESGDGEAASQLLPLLYDELRRIARENMARERIGHTLQPTALVHEAWVRLLGAEGGAKGFEGREHFLRAAAQVMRRVLVDHARARNAEKRGGGPGNAVELDDVVERFEAQGTDLVELDDALSELDRVDSELARIVELRTFGGLTMDDVARSLGVSKATAERRARVARMWLARALGFGAGPGGEPAPEG